MKENRCIMCGEIIPEGRQICINCENGIDKRKEEKRKEFLEHLLDECEYWKDKDDGVYGVVFSILVMFDGYSSINDFKAIDIDGITNGFCLHDDFCKLRRERNEKV